MQAAFRTNKQASHEPRAVSSFDPTIAYRTEKGIMFRAEAQKALKSPSLSQLKGKVQLVLTSPPFPLNRKKRYGNLYGEEYVKWLGSYASVLKEFLTDTGSIVLELGNAWQPGEPIMSTLALKALLKFLESGNLYLCQQFVSFNKARLPGPAQWVNVDRIRVKDAYTHIWWMSVTKRPKADNRRVLTEYSPAMLKLLSTQSYNSGKRPSEHSIGVKSFLRDNAGSIPSNVLTVTNTAASDPYMRYCRKHNIRLHPARMPKEIPRFFINMLTEENDIVMDPFSGSNITGHTAEELGRCWISIERDFRYARSSKARFSNSSTSQLTPRKRANLIKQIVLTTHQER